MLELYIDTEVQAVAAAINSVLGGLVGTQHQHIQLYSFSVSAHPPELRPDRLKKNCTVTLETMLPAREAIIPMQL